MNEIDLRILNMLRSDGRRTYLDMATQLGMASSAVLERVRKLERNGIIIGYETRIDSQKAGLDLQVMLAIETTEKVGVTGVGHQLSKMPEVCQIYEISGKYSYLLKVMLRNTVELSQFMQRIGKIKGVTCAETTLILSTLKNDSCAELRESEI